MKNFHVLKIGILHLVDSASTQGYLWVASQITFLFFEKPPKYGNLRTMTMFFGFIYGRHQLSGPMRIVGPIQI